MLTVCKRLRYFLSPSWASDTMWHGENGFSSRPRKPVFRSLLYWLSYETFVYFSGLTALLKVKLPLCLANYAPCYDDVGERGDIFPLFLTVAQDGGDWSAIPPSCFTPGKEPLVPVGYILAGCAPEPVWILCRRKSVRPCRESNPAV
jgi:hypothetical protein